MKSHKKWSVLVVLLAISTISTAQQMYLEMGKTMSSFDYENSQGEGLENLQTSSYNFMALGYRKQMFTERLNLSLGVNYAAYGAVGSDDEVGNIMKWELHYLEVNFGIDYTLFRFKKNSFYVKEVTSLGFLVQGTQTLNHRIIDLKDNDDFYKPVLDFRFGAGFMRSVSNDISIYAQYMYGYSIANKNETEQSGGEESLRIESHNISFGILINLFKSKATQN